MYSAKTLSLCSGKRHASAVCAFFGATILIAQVGNSAEASLVGDTVNYDRREWKGEAALGTNVTVVDPGSEVTDDVLNATFEADFSDDEISITNTGGNFDWDANFDGGFAIEFNDLDWVNNPTGEITNVSFSTTSSGADLTALGLDAHSYTLYSNTTFDFGSGDTINMTLDTTDTTTVPIPKTITLAVSGFLGLLMVNACAICRRRIQYLG